MNIKNKIVTAFTLAVLVVPGVSLAQTTTSVASLQAEINSLLAEVQSLETQLTAQGGSTNAWCYTFNTNLSIGMSGNAVTELQTALQKDGESVTINGTFDDQTAAAVTGFQEKYQSAILAPYGLTNGTGYAGKATRAELNSLFGCTGATTNPGPAPIVPPICPAWGCNGPEPIVPTVPVSTTTPPLSSTSPDIMSFTATPNSSFPYPNTYEISWAINNNAGNYPIVPSLTFSCIQGLTVNFINDGGQQEAYQCGVANTVDGTAVGGDNFSFTNATPNPITETVTLSVGTIQTATLRVIVPTSGPASVQTPTSTATAPTITNISPSSGPVGTTVTITGSGFSLPPPAGGGNEINFNGCVLAGFQSSPNGTTLTFVVPSEIACPPILPQNVQSVTAKTYEVTVINGEDTADGMSNAMPFTVTGTSTAPSSTITQETPNDASRIANLQEVQNALTIYRNACSFYPGGLNCTRIATPTSWSALGVALNFAALVGNPIPNDPSGGITTYDYGVNATNSHYILEATLSSASSPLFSGYPASSFSALIPTMTWTSTVAPTCTPPQYCVTL